MSWNSGAAEETREPRVETVNQKRDEAHAFDAIDAFEGEDDGAVGGECVVEGVENACAVGEGEGDVVDVSCDGENAFVGGVVGIVVVAATASGERVAVGVG